MSPQKPLLRSPQLTPLSREHYEGLLVAWKIQQGLKRNASLGTISDFINWFWKSHLQSHFEDEERNFTRYLSPGDELLSRMLSEHQTLRHLVLASAPASGPDIALFAQTLHDHIRFEERELFPHLEKKLTETQLDEILAALSRGSTCATDWNDEFWKR